jgi:flagellar biosynthesis chaperone FliJ
MRQQRLEQLEVLLNELQGQYKGSSQQISLLFQLNNEFTPNKEHGKGCGSCRARVYQRMQQFWNETGKQELETLKTKTNEN